MVKNDELYDFGDVSDLELNYTIKLNHWLQINEDYNERKYLKEAILYNERSISHLTLLSVLEEEYDTNNAEAIVKNFQLSVRSFKDEPLPFQLPRKDTDIQIPLITHLFQIYQLLGEYIKIELTKDPSLAKVNVKDVITEYATEINRDYILVDQYIHNFIKENFYFKTFIKKYKSNSWENDLEKYSFFDFNQFYTHLHNKNEVVQTLKSQFENKVLFQNSKYGEKEENDIRLKIIMLKEIGFVEFIEQNKNLKKSKIHDFISDLVGCTNRNVRTHIQYNKLDHPTKSTIDSYLKKLKSLKRDEMDGDIRKDYGLFLQNKKIKN